MSSVVSPQDSPKTNETVGFLSDENSGTKFESENPLPPSMHASPSKTECLFVVLCSPDGGFWPWTTCALGFLAGFFSDGVCLSLFLFDTRVGMANYMPFQMHTLEHIAVISMFRYLIEPFSCAYINRYGFRHCLFFGSILSIIWCVLICFIENAFISKYWFVWSIVGGSGMGMIKTSFSLLLSTLFLKDRQKAHFVLHLGSFTGMLLIPPCTEFVILTVDWQTSLIFYLVLACFTLVFWLFVATPMPLKIEVIDEDPETIKPNFRSKEMAIAQNVLNLSKNDQLPTIWNTIGNRELRMMPFMENIQILSRTESLKSVGLKNIHQLYKVRNHEICIRNVRNMFNSRVIGSRPMYRDDILFNSNVSLLVDNVKHNEFKYSIVMTRIFTMNDLKQEKKKQFYVLPTAMYRVLMSMYDITIWCEGLCFVLVVASEVLIHASCYVPFIFIKGPMGQKSSAEAVITLITSVFGLLSGRGIGYFLHESSPNVEPVPLYAVSIVLIANGLSLFLSATNNLADIILYFGIFGCLFGYYKSIQNATLYNVFCLKKFNNVHGYISIFRALSSFAGIMIAISIQKDEPTNEIVFDFAGQLMTAGGVCVGILHAVSTSSKHIPCFQTL